MKIAIAGYGLEGGSNYEYFKHRGDITIVDEREAVSALPDGVPTILGAGAFSKLEDYDLVIRSAGVAPRKITTNGKIWSATNEFFAQCTTPIIGVTGTKGKGTTASLIHSILRAAGKKSVLVGNIGVPALDALDEANAADVVVYELSSFQLWDIQKSPHVAVVLMIEPDHLDVHASYDEYVEAKANIRRYQTLDDICFYHPTNLQSHEIADAAGDESNLHRYNDSSDPQSVFVESNTFFIQDTPICTTSALQLAGAHNLENACAAISAAWLYTQDTAAIEQGLRNFSGLPHRLKFVREIDGVKFYDDSIATTPGSAIAAMKAFAEPKVIILGGSSKGANFNELAHIASQENVTRVIAIGTEAPIIEAAFSAQEIAVTNLGLETTMDQIVHAAKNSTTQGGVVILSPACASFDMFKSYNDRGDQFVAAVDNL